MAFWPAAVAILFYSMNPTRWKLVVLVVLLFTSSMMYLALRQMKQAFESIMEKSSRRKSVSRGSKRLLTRKVVGDVMDLMNQVFPSATISWWVVTGSFIINAAAGAWFLFLLVDRALSTSNPEITVVGLAVLPVLYAFTVVSILIWNY